MKDWLLKVRHYAGGESIVASFMDQGDAVREAAHRNLQYQTDTYFVEKFDQAKLTRWDIAPTLDSDDIFPDW